MGLLDTVYTQDSIMYKIQDICHVHLEISSRCNAECPLCPRNFFGYPFNDGYIEHDMTVKEAQTIFSTIFLKQLKEIYINGNFGDAVMNINNVAIIEYFRKHSSAIISMSTNAGARDTTHWQDLARLNVHVIFCIDGLEDTHSLYRKNTQWSTVIKNAKTFIAAGGHATWKMIRFDHNQHQFSKARELSKHLGFEHFIAADHGRNQAPVFNKEKKLMHVIGQPANVNFDSLWKTRTTDEVLLEDIVPGRIPKPIQCKIKQQRSLYISSTGDVYPCCFLGFNPKTYGHGNYHEAANAQFKHMVQENNALQHSLEHCIQWFDGVVQSWNQPTFEQGRLVICNDNCGCG
jgi:MoaA/NifB/PqqE/SkfB family radical SAM enzyme